MRANELMIGDFVMFTSKFGYGIGQIEGIEPREGSAEPTTFTIRKKDKDGNTILFVGVGRTCVKPITLTLEILEKNGFELRDGFLYHRIDDNPHHYDFKLKNGGVFTSEGYTLECGIYYLTIRYVHELQNALRLCGLNDLADIFQLI